MGGDRIPPLSTLDRPENYKDLLKDEADDCLGCRIIGGSESVCIKQPFEHLSKVIDRAIKKGAVHLSALVRTATFRAWRS
ncbi:hypothetical protein OOU_Y34scaffold00094g11 [Pyricularia oryzae Y34]|uniref:Uncharacterized protein n=2 Tax=Pyricularia oryzae TaxID=318829 RepID=A0AA97PRB1_PYRO3|nr:hypothetical protein OOU_Y34scaffold00094g11 [Pyricularia oryzae Y34]